MSNRINEFIQDRTIESPEANPLPPLVNQQSTQTAMLSLSGGIDFEASHPESALQRDRCGRQHEPPQSRPTPPLQNPALNMLSLQRQPYAVQEPLSDRCFRSEVSLVHQQQKIAHNLASSRRSSFPAVSHEAPQPLISFFTDQPGKTDTDESSAIAVKRQDGEHRSFFSQQLQDSALAASMPLSAPTFPQKLYEMLLELERIGETDVASFVPNGPGFCIHKETEFAQRIVPRFFAGMNHPSSFQRQLNLYGFTRTQIGSNSVVHTHPLFMRCRPLLCTLMKRQKRKATAQVAANAKSTESDGKLKEDSVGDAE